jgi:putative two-component system response regulator
VSAVFTGAEVLVVDDQAPVRDVLERILTAAGYRCRTAGSVAEGRTALAARAPALVLCDIDMPGENGLVLVDEITRVHPDVAVLMVTAIDDPAVADVALDDGAFGYVIKPFERNEILISVTAALRRRATVLEARAAMDHLERQMVARTLELDSSLAALRDATSALDRTHEDTIRRLACAAEFRDPETAHHLERMSRYSALLARAAGWSADQCELLRLASPMHDVGKIGIPDEVLMKPGIFTPEDRQVMERHPEIGYRLLSGSGSALLELAAIVALHHHERIDGSGYPHRLRGEEISVAGRIVAIADVFDALTSERRYKAAMSVEDARDLMVASRGTHFDEGLLDLFVAELDEVDRIRHLWAEPGAAQTS